VRTRDIIEGLTILEKYHDKAGGFNCGAEHDVLYAYPTDKPVKKKDLDRLIKLGWRQHEVDTGEDDFAAKHYDPAEGWSAYT
jgi:hypothetical protein